MTSERKPSYCTVSIIIEVAFVLLLRLTTQTSLLCTSARSLTFQHQLFYHQSNFSFLKKITIYYMLLLPNYYLGVNKIPFYSRLPFVELNSSFGNFQTLVFKSLSACCD